jgi:peptidoglycan hydrolase-like protein with peptidoglycan-binding domain
MLQKDLITVGYDVGKTGADGKFGGNTEKAVKAFQTDHPPLVSDGICGPMTWKAIEAELTPQPGPEPGTETYTVTIPGVTKDQAEELCSEWSGATMKKD